MGIDQRFTAQIAGRFRNRRVLETCTGGGFTTIALAREASHVFTVEINPVHQTQAKQNLATAGLADRVTFVLADIMDEKTWGGLHRVDAAFLDPDWAITGPDHVHRFVRSTTRPPADALLERTLRATRNVALILPPTLDTHELDALPVHERQKLYMGQSHELYCLYFGNLAVLPGETELRV
jgi:tRNA1(Val) A37 N6-methylase TrmN6